MTLTLVPCWLAGTSIADPSTRTESDCGASDSWMFDAPARHCDHLKSGRGDAQLVVLEQRGNVEIEMSLVVRNLLDDHPDIVDRSDLRAGDRAVVRDRKRFP